MKRIVILCDGTWNVAEHPHPTNVVRLAQALAPSGDDGLAQVPVYVEGVGTGRRGVTWLARTSDRVLGGMLGLGLLDNVVEAYRHLVFLYEPGDEVYVFGFSRGAFTARSLVGFIGFTGLLSRADLARLPEAVARYTERRQESAARRQMRNAEWRALHSPWIITDPADAPVYAEFGADQAIPFDIDYLGVWDTVGALGVPGLLTPGTVTHRRYAFHNTALGPMVRSARHAVAIDERRKPFRPTLWDNLEALNADREGRPYRQEYFPGDHGAIGGGGPITHQSAVALDWIMAGAEAAGLGFDPLVRRKVAEEGDPLGHLQSSDPPNGGLFAEAMRRFGRSRDPVATWEAVSEAARRRWACEFESTPPYRPPPLGPREAELRAWKAERDGGHVT
ncbi:DUF2235 domain-containing protein [uncultured Jannaschia sp.]|uniref:DUF2235 domain-containing protein n=1 Tax=uncultured Jannaschia sp. TaxID=293347 RepID=UPI0026247B7B|nr:DUF2235 domain-containing protein [uncultured Jannaschia sp.]